MLNRLVIVINFLSVSNFLNLFWNFNISLDVFKNFQETFFYISSSIKKWPGFSQNSNLKPFEVAIRNF